MLDSETGWFYVDPDSQFTIYAEIDDQIVIELLDRYGKAARFFFVSDNEPPLSKEIEDGHLFDWTKATVGIALSYYDKDTSCGDLPSSWKPLPRKYLSTGCGSCPETENIGLITRAKHRMWLFTWKASRKRKGRLWRILFFMISFFLELLFQFSDWVRSISMPSAFKWLIAVVIFIVSPIFLYVKPDPFVETLLNIGLFGLALWIGLEKAEERGKRIANDRWLPQALSAMNRILTIWASVRSFKSELSDTCKSAATNLPELENEANKAIKTLFSAHCGQGSKRLGDIVNHLEDALEDWNRFVQKTCQGEDCNRIATAIEERKQLLKTQ